ncbi:MULTISPECIES: hypothetical protein [Sphingobacterium]|uniref:DUF4440 domain-containing protein n=1 Tax=Sphingobacterium kitahiroshimense TaxID=470446 RepID=A0ABV0BNI6_9SPHI|nr:hypothetical protein [Sphingobacterium sp. B16(2022)]NJI74070.1 hypothetical protein [Sphingobacterium sp. B16(2022)]
MDFKTVLSEHDIDNIVEMALLAWQQGDSLLFLSYFKDKAQLLDAKGQPHILKNFVKSGCKHAKFTMIEKVENGGKDVIGTLQSKKWGVLKVYFKFKINYKKEIISLCVELAS